MNGIEREIEDRQLDREGKRERERERERETETERHELRQPHKK